MARKVAKKRARKRTKPKREVWLDPEWTRARDEVAAAFAAQEIKDTFLPYGAAGKRIATGMVKAAEKRLQFVLKAINRDLPEAQAEFDADHPPCRPGPRCRHHALLEVAAQNAFEAGHARNPTVAFRMMQVVLDKYLRSRS